MHAFDGQTDGWTDGQTDRILIVRPHLHSMQRGKKITVFDPVICSSSDAPLEGELLH